MVLTVKEACEALTISRPTFYALVARGDLRTVSIGRRRVVPVSAIDRFLGNDVVPTK